MPVLLALAALGLTATLLGILAQQVEKQETAIQPPTPLDQGIIYER